MINDHEVSIVIPTYNRNELLIRVLPSYLKQKNVFEGIIVDDGSEVPVKEFLQNSGYYDERLHIIRHVRSMGLCSARNTGILSAKSKWIFFGEDDLLLSENHIENLHNERIKLGADLICGDIIQQESDESLEDAWERSVKQNMSNIFNNRLISINYGSVAKPVELPFAHAIFLAPTEILKKYLFSTRIGGPSFMREDQELHLTLRNAGYRLFAIPNAIGFHLSRSISHGSGTRLNHSVFIHIASSIINTWQVLNEHYKMIAPFYGSISKRVMIRRSIFWLIFIEIKRRMQIKYNWLGKYIRLLR